MLSGTSPAGSPHDQNERARIRSALQDLRMSHVSHLHDDRPPLLPPPARTIQPAAVTPCEESFHMVQPSAFRTSDFRPSRSQARHLHCRRTTSPQHVRKQQIALLFSRESLLRGTSPAGSPHDHIERASIHSALQDLRNTHPHGDRPNFPTTTSSSLSPAITLSH